MKSYILLAFCATLVSIVSAIEYKPRYQPVDTIELDTYLKNTRLWAIQERCLLRDGPCDSIGRWIKSRLYHAVATGECILCTPKQAKELNKLITYLIEKRPELYEQGVRKFLAEKGITVTAIPLPKTTPTTTSN